MIALAIFAMLFAVTGDASPKAIDTLSPAANAPRAATGPDNPVTRPLWTRRPTQNDLVKFYPPGISGIKATVLARCLIDATGKFSSCDILQEEPARMGFGEATIRLSKLFQMKPADGEGMPVAGRKLNLPVVWYPH